MKATFILLLIVLLPSICKSQIRSSIDFIGGVEYSYRDLITSPSSRIDRRNENETGKLAWRAGFNYNIRFTNNLVFKTGVRYAKVGYLIKDDFRILLWTIGDVAHILDTVPMEMGLNISLGFLEIPIAVRYEFSQKKFAPFVELGAAPSVNLKTKAKLIADSGVKQFIESFTDAKVPDFSDSVFEHKKLHLVGLVSFGANYNVSENFQLFGQSIFRYHFTTLVDEPIKENLFNCGLEIGLRKKIN